MISVAELRNKIADAINRAAYRGERIIIERRGKPTAAIVSMQDLETLEAMEEAEDLKAARRARREKGEVTLNELKEELGL